MFRKWLAIGLIIMLVGSLAIVFGCSSDDGVKGEWQLSTDSDQHYTLEGDGDFTVVYKDPSKTPNLTSGKGDWEVDGSTITFTFSTGDYFGDTEVTGTLNDAKDEITDELDHVWEKQ